MFKICKHQFRQAFLSPRIYLAILLGCSIQIISAFPLLEYSSAMGKPLGILEAFIYFNCDIYTAACVFLGIVLLVADIPFSTQNETYTLLRVSRRKWVGGKILYLLGICTIYYIIIFLAGILFISGNALISNSWSQPLTAIAKNQSPELATQFQLFFPYGNVMALSPVIAAALCLALSICYGFIMSLFIFWLNLKISRALSYLAASMVHVVGYLLTALFLSGFYRKFSLFGNSLLMYHNIRNYPGGEIYLTLPQSFLTYGVVTAALILFISKAIRAFDFRITVGTRQ